MSVAPNSSAPTALALCQLVRLEALQARVPAALRRAVDELYGTLDQLVQDLGGARVRSPAVGVLTTWPDVSMAVRFGLALQVQLLERDWPTTLLLRPEAAEEFSEDGTLLYRGPRVRCAIHLGQVDTAKGLDGMPVLGGPAVYQVARLVSTLHGGQVVASDAAVGALHHPTSGAQIDDLGRHHLNGVQGTVGLHQVTTDALAGRVFPKPMTRDVTRTNAPPARQALLGRDGDVQALTELSEMGLRLITLVGPSGVGKSRLLARHLVVNGGAFVQEGGGGAWLTRADGPTTAAVVAAVARSLNLSLRFGRSEQALLDHVGASLKRRGRLLLALDAPVADPDHLARICYGWLAAAPEMRMLVATSSRLGLPGEVAYELGGLASAEAGNARNADAVRLFVQGAQRSAPRFRASDPDLLAEIVNHLEGNPQSILFASGLTHQMSIERLAAEVSLLDGTPSSVADLVWSNLDDSERRILSNCAVYPDGFDRMGAEAVVDAMDGEEPLEVLERLVRRGLVNKVDDPRSPQVSRYRLNVRVRERARAALQPDERTRAQRRAADRILEMCESWADRAWGIDGAEVLARLEVEWGNLSGVALLGASPHAEAEDVERGLRATAVLWPLVAVQGPAQLFVRLLDPVLRRADTALGADPVLQARCLRARAEARRYLGDYTQAQADAYRGAEVAERWGAAKIEGLCRLSAGRARYDRNCCDPEALEDFLAAAEKLAEPSPGFAAVAQGAAGLAYLMIGQFEASAECLDGAVSRLRALGWLRQLGRELTSRGLLSQRQRGLDLARTSYGEAATIQQAIGDRRALGICLMHTGALELCIGDSEASALSLERALEALRYTGDRRSEATARRLVGLARLHAGDIDGAREHLLAALALNRKLRSTLGEAVDAGYLGVIHHLVGQRDSAREAYDRVLRVMEAQAPPRLRALFYAWSGGLAAEAGEARADNDFAVAREAAATSSERSVQRTVGLLEGIGRARAAPVERADDLLAEEATDRDLDVGLARRRLEAVLMQGAEE